MMPFLNQDAPHLDQPQDQQARRPLGGGLQLEGGDEEGGGGGLRIRQREDFVAARDNEQPKGQVRRPDKYIICLKKIKCFFPSPSQLYVLNECWSEQQVDKHKFPKFKKYNMFFFLSRSFYISLRAPPSAPASTTASAI